MIHWQAMMNKVITIFTDGAAKGNPGRGGYGAVILDGDTVTEIGGHKTRTTNNEMELRAVVEALKMVNGSKETVAIYTDSKYVVEGAKGWVYGWAKNGWKTKAKTDVINKELWQELLPLLKQVTIEWHKVPGHVGIIGNERADTIASDYAETGKFQLYAGTTKDYKLDLSDTSYDESKAEERSDARKRQAQKAYSYVSLLDGVVKVHQTWAECEGRVKGKGGTRFKKSLSAANEKEIIKDFGGK
jgi:ribonuclease HI